MTRQNVVLAQVLIIISGCLGGEYCSYNYNGGSGVKYMYCDVTCCGSYYERYCCALTSTALYVGAIAGGVICVGLIIGIVVCCVYKGKTRVRRHRHINNDATNVRFECSRIYGNDSPKPPPYEFQHHPSPPEYHSDPPPRYLTPLPGSEFHHFPGSMEDS
ncbi:protein shisa-4-like [Saccostrea echinata]|uniref:protein shisa-4-like n=1 Tax=Saccostrea echinata TaxID=191078 RepID=UPI002A83993B|nr:protein shisa-4-like [Saccostrea echinata]